MKITEIFDSLHILDNMYLNIPDNKAAEYDYLNELFNSSTELDFHYFCKELIMNIRELTEIGIFDYSKLDAEYLYTKAQDPDILTVMLKFIETTENQSKFFKYIK